MNTIPKKAWLYFVLTFGWSWLFLLVPILGGWDADQPLTIWLRVLSGIGPALSTIYLLYTTGSPETRLEYWQRLISFQRIKVHWWFVILFTPLVLILMAGGLDFLMGGIGLVLEEGLPEAANPIAWLGFLVFLLIFGPVPEELGWRGYVLDKLLDHRKALFSNLLLGTAWALWHIPLFFIEGTYQAGLGIFTGDFWIFMLMMIPESILIGWVFNNTRRSTLSAVFFHFAINLTGEIFAVSATGNWFYLAGWILAAGLVVLFTNPANFQRRLRNDKNRKNIDKEDR